MTATEFRWGNFLIYCVLIYSLEENKIDLKKVKEWFDFDSVNYEDKLY
jgi:hypothetical protein